MTRIIINPFGRSFPIQKRDSVLSKIDLFPKQVANDLPNKRLAKGFCFIKSLSHLHSKVSLQKGFGKTNLFVKALPFKRRNGFKAKQVSKSFDLKSFLKMICFTKQRFSKRLWSPKPASRDQP